MERRYRGRKQTAKKLVSIDHGFSVANRRVATISAPARATNTFDVRIVYNTRSTEVLADQGGSVLMSQLLRDRRVQRREWRYILGGSGSKAEAHCWCPSH